MDVIRHKATSVYKVIDLLEKHFLSARTKRLSEQVWEELSFRAIEQKRNYEKKLA